MCFMGEINDVTTSERFQDFEFAVSEAFDLYLTLFIAFFFFFAFSFITRRW